MNIPLFKNFFCMEVIKNEEESQKLVSIPQFSLTKVHWRKFMSESDKSIAEEFTNIDWIMFSSFRPRDVVRHVTLNIEDKKLFKRLINVDRMINQFNHTAYFVANLILLRDKAKHRAMIMEKLMKVARVSIYTFSKKNC